MDVGHLGELRIVECKSALSAKGTRVDDDKVSLEG